MLDKKIIFIGGSSFSGSTLLDMILASGNKGFSLGEVYALFYPYRLHHINPKCICNDPNCDILRKLKEKGAKKIYDLIFDYNNEIEFIIDSSKNPFWISKQSKNLQKKGYKIINVLIWKTPAEFAYSKYKRKSFNNWQRAWKNYYKLYFSTIPDWIGVKYSELAKNSSKTLKQLCKYIEIDYFPNKENFWNYKHHTLFGNNSAKIHLFFKGSERYTKCDDEISGMRHISEKDKESHRTIYYDEKNYKLIENDIKIDMKDEELKLILRLLKSTTLGEKYDENEAKKLRNEIIMPSIKYNLYKTNYFCKMINGLIYHKRKTWHKDTI